MAYKSIHSAGAPAPIGPYSQAIAAGPFVFTSGVIGIDPASGALAGDDAASQTRAVLSPEAVTTRMPSGENAAQLTSPASTAIV